jgi:hypothetical protein
MRQPVLRALLGALVILAVVVPAASAEVGPDYVSSDNVTLVDRIKTVGDGVGAKIVGDRLFVTSTKSLSIFDIGTDPEHPKQIGVFTLDVEFENEEVPTNGKILGISAQYGCKDPLGLLEGSPRPPSTGEAHCLNLYDVSDPANVKFIKSVAGAGEHTSACVYDCQYFWGDNGTVTDARDPKNAKIIGNWSDASGVKFKSSCHHVREIQPGIVFGSCQPLILLSARPEHGGSITKPVVLSLASNKDDRFIHSNKWPRQGLDKFALVGGEQNATPSCDDEGVSAFMVWDATPAIDGNGGFKMGGTFNLLSEVRPENGNYADGHSPYNGLGCSVHWFSEHPTFRDGGLVALAEYENGTRFLQITSTGQIREQGYFLPLGGSTSAPHWHSNGKVVYNIDYTRGVDVLRYTGLNYVPPDASGNVPDQPGNTPGTNGVRDEKAIADQRRREASQAENCSLIATAASARRRGRGLRLGAGGARFDAQIFQLSRGRSIIRKRRVARFNGATGEKTWSGRTPGGRTAGNGFYIVRMKTGGKFRQLAFQRRGGRFVARPDFQTGSSCGALRGFQLRSPVFGGRRNVAASVSFGLAQNADSVRIEAVQGGKKVRTVTRRNVRANRTVRVSVPARGIKRGAVTFRIVAVRGGTVIAQTVLGASRL